MVHSWKPQSENCPSTSDPYVIGYTERNMDSSDEIICLNKILFFNLSPLFCDVNNKEYTLYHDFKSEERFREMTDIFTLSYLGQPLIWVGKFSIRIFMVRAYIKI